MVNLNIGEWIVKALELFEKSKILRKMYYAGLLCVALYVLAKALPGIAAIIAASNHGG